MQKVTIIAVIAAAAAGIIAYAVLSNNLADSAGYIGSLDSKNTGPGTGHNTTNVATPNNNTYQQINVTVNAIELVADVADTNEKRSKGLSVKETLNETEAMLFVFNTDREHSFWMKGMKFPIDIIWINEGHRVVHIEHSLEPCVVDSFCQTYKPDRNSLYVLETVAGFAQKYNVTENTYVDFQLDDTSA